MSSPGSPIHNIHAFVCSLNSVSLIIIPMGDFWGIHAQTTVCRHRSVYNQHTSITARSTKTGDPWTTTRTAPSRAISSARPSAKAAVNREVAIKVILPQYANQPEFVCRFEVEPQFAARLEHPHIVPLYDYWRDPDGTFLVMRWLPGSLRASLGRGSWLPDKTACIVSATFATVC